MLRARTHHQQDKRVNALHQCINDIYIYRERVHKMLTGCFL